MAPVTSGDRKRVLVDLNGMIYHFSHGGFTTREIWDLSDFSHIHIFDLVADLTIHMFDKSSIKNGDLTRCKTEMQWGSNGHIWSTSPRSNHWVPNRFFPPGKWGYHGDRATNQNAMAMAFLGISLADLTKNDGLYIYICMIDRIG